MPQMIPISLPTVINDFIYMFKDSSILSLIAVLELTAQANGLGRLFGVYSWQFFAIGALLYLALSLPLGRLSRVVEARLRTHTFAQGRDLTSLAGQALEVSIVFGWLAGVVANAVSSGAFSFGIIASLIGQLGAALILTLALLIGTMLLLGIPVYGIGALIRQVRELGRGKPPAATDSIALSSARA
jgi:hypothetical protein